MLKEVTFLHSIHNILPTITNHFLKLQNFLKKMKILPYDTIRLLTNIINGEHLLYKYADVMQQIDNSLCGFFTIAYVVDITFGLNLEQYI
jgi:hypothetical protein